MARVYILKDWRFWLAGRRERRAQTAAQPPPPHPRGDHPPQRETATSHELAELRAEVDALRAGLASLGRELADVRGELAGQYPSERRGA